MQYSTDENYLTDLYMKNHAMFIPSYREWISRVRTSNEPGMPEVIKLMTERAVSFIIRNGLLSKEMLNIPGIMDYIKDRNMPEHDKFCLVVYGVLPFDYDFINKWYVRILSEMVTADKENKPFSLDNIEHISAYNRKYISSRFIDPEKMLDITNTAVSTSSPYLTLDNIMKLVEIGKAFRVRSPGFNDSELYYVTVGLAYANLLHHQPKKYGDIIDTISSVIQCNPINIVINAKTCLSDKDIPMNDNWSLVTYIKHGEGNNYRYLPALKYVESFHDFDEAKGVKSHRREHKYDKNYLTKYILKLHDKAPENITKWDDKYKDIHIYTEYDLDTINKVNGEISALVDQYFDLPANTDDAIKNRILTEIFIKFVDTQQFTRGTCIIAQLMLSYLMHLKAFTDNGEIRLLVNNDGELPDWAAVAGKFSMNMLHNEDIDWTKLNDIIPLASVSPLVVLYAYRLLIMSYN
jgi:hypothetical protein